MRDLYDTRPTRPVATDTQPIEPIRRPMPWGLLALLGFTLAAGGFVLMTLWGYYAPPTVASAAVHTPTPAADPDRVVVLTVDGATSVFRTVIDNPAAILRAAGVRFGADDAITVNGSPVAADQLDRYPLPANRISVRHAVRITVSDGAVGTFSRATTADTVSEALAEAGITLYLGDQVEPPPATELRDGMGISIDRAAPVTLNADGATIETRTQAATVSAFLAEQGVALNGLDYAVPPENANLTDGMAVRVVRVTEEIIAEVSEVPFETVYQADGERELDTRAVTVAGQPGRDERRTRIRYEDGVEVSRRDEGVVRVQEPVNQVVNYGTRVVLRTIDTPDGPREYWRVLRMYATSYHPAALGGDNVTATGKILTKGIVAVNPRIVSYGTRVYVNGYGEGEAADTGGPRSTPYWIDLGYDDENWRSWSGWVQVYLLTPVPDNVNPLLP
ncbi:MAG: ubiquitin-like domain-containing protein [Anaerolineae bacterium]|jgi:uncharacterized protein YabE (DUF348 family)|nr:ubiquitin-like domain-containing protein [Anaerolineae bacterium]